MPQGFGVGWWFLLAEPVRQPDGAQRNQCCCADIEVCLTSGSHAGFSMQDMEEVLADRKRLQQLTQKSMHSFMWTLKALTIAQHATVGHGCSSIGCFCQCGRAHCPSVASGSHFFHLYAFVHANYSSICSLQSKLGSDQDCKNIVHHIMF
jgi:hypothetical protein